MRPSILAAVAALVLAGCADTVAAPNETGGRHPVAATTSASASPSPSSPSPSSPSVTLSPTPFETQPTEPFSFAVIGDWGSGDAAEQAVARRMCKWREAHPYGTVVTTGDNIYATGDPALFRERFREPMRCLLNKRVRFHVALGNHDVVTDAGRPEIDYQLFGMKARNYVFRKGGVRFVVADSNEMDEEWLGKALKPKVGDRWTVVVFHHPVYSSGLHGSTEGFRPSLPRMFKQKGVDLVLNGHDHSYEVTKELGGIRYVVTGGGGARLYPCGKSWFTDGECVSTHHFVYVEAGPDRIKVWAVPLAGRPIDRFVTDGRI